MDFNSFGLNGTRNITQTTIKNNTLSNALKALNYKKSFQPKPNHQPKSSFFRGPVQVNSSSMTLDANGMQRSNYFRPPPSSKISSLEAALGNLTGQARSNPVASQLMNQYQQIEALKQQRNALLMQQSIFRPPQQTVVQQVQQQQLQQSQAGQSNSSLLQDKIQNELKIVKLVQTLNQIRDQKVNNQLQLLQLENLIQQKSQQQIEEAQLEELLLRAQVQAQAHAQAQAQAQAHAHAQVQQPFVEYGDGYQITHSPSTQREIIQPKTMPEYESEITKPQENMKLNTLSFSMRSQTRTSKTILNENAQKFKLSKLETNIIRYECIYKNLLRDVRKVFTILFNSQTQYQSAKKKIMNVSYFQYVKDFLSTIFGKEKLDYLGIDLDTATFYFGSFIYPKYMIKFLNEDQGKNLVAEVKANNQQNVLNIYYYSYKFSLERLQILINEPQMMILIIYYAEYTKLQRIHEKRNMEKFKEAYYEAITTMINNSNQLQSLMAYIQKFTRNDLFQIIDNKVSLDQLQTVNSARFSNKQVLRKRDRSESSEYSAHKIQKTEEAMSEQKSNVLMAGDDDTISENQ